MSRHPFEFEARTRPEGDDGDPVYTATQASAALEARRRRMEDASGDLLAALQALLQLVPTIEVLGEWEGRVVGRGQDINRWPVEIERAKINTILDQAHAAIARATKEAP